MCAIKGNVIAALSSSSVGHVRFRDTKLTMLLKHSLGGTASTVRSVEDSASNHAELLTHTVLYNQALIATVGPAAISGGETLSTLLFASRCMAVKADPIQHEEVNYAEMYARLQVGYRINCVWCVLYRASQNELIIAGEVRKLGA